MTRIPAMLSLLAILAAGCGHENFDCLNDSHCDYLFSTSGLRCFNNGLTGTSCALVDNGCASGYRWEDFAGSFSNSCVLPSQLPSDAGISDARGD